jgi:hypothetical protein
MRETLLTGAEPSIPATPKGVTRVNPLTLAQQQDIDKRFTYHSPKDDQPARYQALRSSAKDLATAIIQLTPASREQSLALTHLEQACFWANASIARNE